jgi:cellulose synthase operon protein YhjQ
MPLVVVVSPKGGVGKTTLTANLAVALQRLGRRVIAVDFDSQNALRFLLLPQGEHGIGLAGCVSRGLPWAAAIQEGRAGVRVVPFGPSTSAERLLLKQILVEERIADGLETISSNPEDLVLIDTAPGDGRLQERLEQLADLEVVCLLADAGSMSLVPSFRDGLLLRRRGNPYLDCTFALLNQVDPRRRLSRDIADFVAQHAGERFIGSVHYDEALAESAAHGLPVVEAVPDSMASTDIIRLASRLDALLSSLDDGVSLARVEGGVSA